MFILALYPTTGNVAQIDGKTAWEFKGNNVQDPNGEAFAAYNKNHLLKAHVSRPIHFKFQVRFLSYEFLNMLHFTNS